MFSCLLDRLFENISIMRKINYLLLISLFILLKGSGVDHNRGEVSTYKQKFIWSGTMEAFVPNYLMIDMLTSDLSEITEGILDEFIAEFMGKHGFNGLHVPVYGQWFHIGEKKITRDDSIPDPRTFEKLKMIITKVYDAGGCTHLWAWGDAQRNQTARSTVHGIMGKEEKKVMDMICEELGPLRGWTMGYGFDLFEWVTEEELDEWHNYMWSKPGWDHLLGARSFKNKLEPISEKMDYISYEYHKPWYDELVTMIDTRPEKPSFSEDRYRIRHPSKYPEKDYDADETRRGLWHHTMAGGVAAIWGNLDGDGVYPNKEALKCFFTFWNNKKRFRKDMERDKSQTDGYCLREKDNYYVFYKENTSSVKYGFTGKPKKVIAVDTRKAYEEISLGKKKAGTYTFTAPYKSDWALAVE